MAIDIKSLLSYELMEMCGELSHRKITITLLLERTGISRRTFYQHFRDMNDLICWIWEKKVWNDSFIRADKAPYDDLEGRFKGYLDGFRRQERNLKFMQYAYSLSGQNCLRNQAIERSVIEESESLKRRYGLSSLKPETRAILDVHACGMFDLTCSWVQNGMKDPSLEEMARYTAGITCSLIGHAVEVELSGRS